MAEPQTPDRSAPAEEKLYTLSEISQRTGISMPTLQRYKKTYQDRIPSVGAGRKQRYPEHSLPVFGELRSENASKRGRPRKDAAAAVSGAAAATPKRRPAKRGAGGRGGRVAAAGARRGRPAAAAPAAKPAGRRPGRPRKTQPAAAAKPAAARRRGRPARAAAGTGRVGRPPGRRLGRPPGSGRAAGASAKPEGLLTLTQISKTTGISYPTLVRYVRLYSKRLPHAGKGRARRFYPEAVEVFRTLRQASGRGGRRAGGRGAAPGTARRGRPPKSAAANIASAASAATGRLEAVLAQRIRDLEKLRLAVEKQFGDLAKGLQRLF